MNQEVLFDLRRDPARICRVCGADLRMDRRGVLQHKRGEGKRCDAILEETRTKLLAHFSDKRAATGEPKP
jgi:hypothetical protein